MIEFLVALALFSSDIYDGQSDPWYARGCLARKYLERWYQITDPDAWIKANYIKPEYRQRANSMYLDFMRKYADKVFV